MTTHAAPGHHTADMTEPRIPFATARGLLRDLTGRWLLVRDERPHWYLPGGWIENKERPRAACEREFFEETGAHVVAGELLVVACHDDGWSLIFDCGVQDHEQLILTTANDPEEPPAAEVRWVPPLEAIALLKPAIAQRMVVYTAAKARGRHGSVYIE